MKKRISIIAIIGCLFSIQLNAQTSTDALRYSQTSITGTARYTSMAGAFGALGGDFSSLLSNPAAIGIYRTSEFTFSSALYMNRTTSDYLGTSASQDRFNFNIPNFGFVFTSKPRNPDKPGWKNWNFGVGLNRLNNFHSDTYYQGFNRNNSMLDHFVENANQNGGLAYEKLDPFYEKLAFDAGLIYHPDTISPYYVSDLKQGDGMLQRRTGTTHGAMNEWNFSFGGNYNNILYLGATFGIRSLYYDDNSTYEEVDRDNVVDVLNSFSFQQNVYTRGTGVNLKLGAIVRPVDWMRIGGSFQTPTVLYMHDHYDNSMASNLTGYNIPRQYSPAGSFDYHLTTPLSATASLGIIVAKTGLIGVDYEMVDYSGTHYSAYGVSYSDINNSMRNSYSSAGNLRVGGEYRWDKLSFRMGYANYGSPFATQAKVTGADFSKTSYSGGLGLRDGNYFLDFAYIYTQGNEYSQPYSLSYQDVPLVRSDIVNHNFVVTLGVKW